MSQQYSRIIEFKSAEEAIRLKEYLELNYIPCQIGQYENSSKSETPSPIIHLISFPNEYYEEYHKLKTENKQIKLFKIEEVKKRSKPFFKKYILIPYAVIISLLCCKFYYSSKAGFSPKNFEYSWALDNKTLNATNKTTQKLSAVYKDENYDDNWEKIYEYAYNRKVAEARDLDENGIFEEYRTLDLDGKLASLNIDSNQDGMIDTIKFILEDDSELILADSNRNGRYENSRNE